MKNRVKEMVAKRNEEKAAKMDTFVKKLTDENIKAFTEVTSNIPNRAGFSDGIRIDIQSGNMNSNSEFMPNLGCTMSNVVCSFYFTEEGKPLILFRDTTMKYSYSKVLLNPAGMKNITYSKNEYDNATVYDFTFDYSFNNVHYDMRFTFAK